MKFRSVLFVVAGLLIFACNRDNQEFDASGNFEAVETTVSAEANGKILAFNINEGQVLKQDQMVGYIDSTQLYLTKLQLAQNRKAILSGKPDINVQLDALQKELDNAISDRNRIENLVKGEVASQKQLDDANTRIAVIQSKIEAQKSSLSTSSNTLTQQGGTVEIQASQVEDQLRKCRIINPVTGTVLVKYTEPFEMAIQGKPLYKIANLDTLIIRVYVSGAQLSQIKIGDTVDVFYDNGVKTKAQVKGVINWISSTAEFTPKTIQTKEERVNLVYAVKVQVANNGELKIGMPGDIRWTKH